MTQAQHPEPMAAFFNDRVFGYEAHMKENGLFEAEKLQFAEQFGSTDAPAQILDLGCGTGLEIGYILQRIPNARLICIDLAEKMLELLREKYQSVLAQIEVVQASYLDYDFGSNRFDYVVASATMHHWLPEPKLKLYRRIFEALKPGGRFIDDDYMVPEDQEWERLEQYIALGDSGALKDGEYFHVDIPFSVPTERRIMEEAGFEEVQVIYEHYSETHCNALLVGVKGN